MIVPVEKERAKTKAKELPAPVGPAKKEQKEPKQKTSEKEYTVTQEAETVLSELLFVLCDLEQIQYENFSPEEREMYEKLDEKRRRNIQNALRE